MPIEKQKFNVVEASIADLHSAIKSGDVTLVEVVQSYLDRVKAYNGVSSMLLLLLHAVVCFMMWLCAS